MLLLVGLFCVISARAGAQLKNSCTTSDGKDGECVPLRDCPHILEVMEKAYPIIERQILIRNRFRCDPVSEKYCCPIPDVSNHQNLKLLPENCGQYPTIEKIFGGNEAALYEFPWMVVLEYADQRAKCLCGGTIINERYILTAAHCIPKNTDQLKLVRIGEYDLTTDIDCQELKNGERDCAPPVQERQIEEIISHAGFNITGFNFDDIALLRLKQPINLTASDSVKPICLPIGEKWKKSNFTNRYGTVTGWGRTERTICSSVLLKANLPFWPTDNCAEVFNDRKNVRLSTRVLCAGGVNRTDSCYGDSGGPLQRLTSSPEGDPHMVQYGIVSFGDANCGTRGLPGVYTSVAHYLDWILDHMKP